MSDYAEHPIIFSGPMVRAILEGRKTQTRRVIKPQPGGDTVSWGCIGGQGFGFIFGECMKIRRCPYGIPGDRLWVRESFRHFGNSFRQGRAYAHIIYPADEAKVKHTLAAKVEAGWEIPVRAEWKHGQSKVRPSIHMPRWACRLILEVKSVRAERVQEISEDDAIAEGIKVLIGPYSRQYAGGQQQWYRNPIDAFKQLWDSINARAKPVHRDPRDMTTPLECYVSYPWEAVSETREKNDKPWFVIGNAWVWVVDYMRTG